MGDAVRYDVESLLAWRVGTEGLEFLVKWYGYTGPESSSWEPGEGMSIAVQEKWFPDIKKHLSQGAISSGETRKQKPKKERQSKATKPRSSSSSDDQPLGKKIKKVATGRMSGQKKKEKVRKEKAKEKEKDKEKAKRGRPKRANPPSKQKKKQRRAATPSPPPEVVNVPADLPPEVPDEDPPVYKADIIPLVIPRYRDRCLAVTKSQVPANYQGVRLYKPPAEHETEICTNNEYTLAVYSQYQPTVYDPTSVPPAEREYLDEDCQREWMTQSQVAHVTFGNRVRMQPTPKKKSARRGRQRQKPATPVVKPEPEDVVVVANTGVEDHPSKEPQQAPAATTQTTKKLTTITEEVNTEQAKPTPTIPMEIDSPVEQPVIELPTPAAAPPVAPMSEELKQQAMSTTTRPCGEDRQDATQFDVRELMTTDKTEKEATEATSSSAVIPPGGEDGQPVAIQLRTGTFWTTETEPLHPLAEHYRLPSVAELVQQDRLRIGDIIASKRGNHQFTVSPDCTLRLKNSPTSDKATVDNLLEYLEDIPGGWKHASVARRDTVDAEQSVRLAQVISSWCASKRGEQIPLHWYTEKERWAILIEQKAIQIGDVLIVNNAAKAVVTASDLLNKQAPLLTANILNTNTHHLTEQQFDLPSQFVAAVHLAREADAEKPPNAPFGSEWRKLFVCTDAGLRTHSLETLWQKQRWCW
eukprot:TRINITY_DN57557_c0_g1_i1.p1 TRINITY_DN57557_c0_g1~~TRINITY_DN57557_c0_g1_i1.p1  ORF type:complete len:697 (+),score=76.68 TRINITY_DN57557_c0_g1_i1:30-2120(+)